VGYAGNPCRELAGVGVAALLDCGDCLDESLLEYVVCNILILNDVVDIIEYAVFVPTKERVESVIVPVSVSSDQHFVGKPVDILHLSIKILVM
jgi:hypothetical protein